MALPTIVFNAVTGGSDTAASGAGPATAVSGTGASLNGTTTVDVSADTPDLSGISKDGDAVLWVDTSSGRQYSKVTDWDNTAKTITVATAYGVTESGKAWGVGGKRATLDHADSRTLFADAQPGWTITLETDQSISSVIAPTADGDMTTGRITIQGDSTTSLRVITQTANAGHLVNSSSAWDFWAIKNLEFICTSSPTKTGANAIVPRQASAGNTLVIENCVFGSSVTESRLNRAISRGDNGAVILRGCEILNTVAEGIYWVGSAGDLLINDCWIHDCGTEGIELDVNNLVIQDSIIEGCGADGILKTGTTVTLMIVEDNTIHGNAGDGIDISAVVMPRCRIVNNNLTGSTGGYGIRAHASQDIGTALIDYNNFGTGATANASGAVAGVTLGANSLEVDPGYTNAAGNDFSVGTNLKAQGYPDAGKFIGSTKTGQTSATASFVDIGVAQREEPAGGGGRPEFRGANL